MKGPDVSRLTPADAVSALRSFPRRFAGVLAIVDPDDVEALYRRGPDGRSAMEHADLAGRDLAVLGDGVRRALDEAHPVLHPAVLDPEARHYAEDIDVSPEAALDLLTLEAEALADRVEHVSADQWVRPVTIAGAPEVTALDVLREAVRTTAVHLAAAEHARHGR